MKIELEDVIKVIKARIDKNMLCMEDMREQIRLSQEKDKLTAKRIEGFKVSMPTIENKKSHIKYYNRATELNHLLGEMKKLGQTKKVITPLTEAESISTLKYKD